ncbi:MAG: class II fructose-bisphosphate aldolase, partial [Planctomycetes bacterium]|nr:class II fructose-bisphosphate aldolase [Planctomycetota bacterium]
MSDKVLSVVSAGVVSGKGIQDVFAVAKANGFALPAVNV